MSDIVVNLVVNDNDFNVKVRDAERVLSQLNKNFRKTEVVAKSSKKSLDHFRASLRDITVVGYGVTGFLQMAQASLLGWQHSIIKASAEIEKLTILMTGLSDAQTQYSKNYEAHKNLNEMIKLAEKAPFAMNELMKSFVKFQAVNLDDPKRMVQGLADAVASFGGSNDEIHRASIAIMQMAGKGVISMEELRQQLGEAVPSAISTMAKQLNMSYAQLVETVSSGSLTARKGLSALLEGWEQDYKGAAERMMGTWSGMVSVMKTRWMLFLDQIGQGGLFESAKNFLGDINEALVDPEVLAWANHFGERLGIMVERLNEVFNWLVANRDQVEKIIDVSTTLFAFWAGGKIFGAVNKASAKMFTPILAGVEKANKAFSAMGAFMVASAVSSTAAVKSAIFAMYSNVMTKVSGYSVLLAGLLNTAAVGFAALFASVGKLFATIGAGSAAAAAAMGAFGAAAKKALSIFTFFIPPVKLLYTAVAAGTAAWVYFTDSVDEAGKKIGIFDRLARDVNNIFESDALLQWRVLWDHTKVAVGSFWDSLYEKTTNYFPFLDTLAEKVSGFFTQTLPAALESLPAKIEEFFTRDKTTVIRYEVEADFKAAEDDAKNLQEAIEKATDLRERLLKRMEETGGNLSAKDQEDQRQYIAWLEILEERYQNLNDSLAETEQRRLEIIESSTDKQVRAYEKRKNETLDAIQEIEEEINEITAKMKADVGGVSTEDYAREIQLLQARLRDLQAEYSAMSALQSDLIAKDREQQIEYEGLAKRADFLKVEVEKAEEALADFNDESQRSVELVKILTPEMRQAKNAFEKFTESATKALQAEMPGQKELIQIKNFTEEYQKFLDGVPTLLADESLGFDEESIKKVGDLYQQVIDMLTVKRLEALRELTATFDVALEKVNEFEIALKDLSAKAGQFEQVYEVEVSDEQYHEQLREQAKKIYEYSEATGELKESSREAAEASLAQVEAQIAEAEAAGKTEKEINRLLIARQVLNDVLDGSIRLQYNEDEAIEAQIQKRKMQIELMEELGLSYVALQMRRSDELNGLSDEQQQVKRLTYFVQDLKAVFGAVWEAVYEINDKARDMMVDAFVDVVEAIGESIKEIVESIDKGIKKSRELQLRMYEATGEGRKLTLAKREDELRQYGLRYINPFRYINPNYYKNMAVHEAEDNAKLYEMQISLLEEQGEAYAVLQARRAQEIKNLSEEQIEVFNAINLNKDMIASRELVIKNMEAQGLEYAALQVRRDTELQGLSDEDRALVKLRHNLEDLNRERELQIELLEKLGYAGAAENLRRQTEQEGREGMPERMKAYYEAIENAEADMQKQEALMAMYAATGQGIAAYEMDLSIRRKAVAGTDRAGILEEQIVGEEQKKLNKIIQDQENALGRTRNATIMYRQSLLDLAETQDEVEELLKLFDAEDQSDIFFRNVELLEAQGRAYEATQMQRERALLGLKGEAKAIQEAIYAAEDEAEVRDAQIGLLEEQGYAYEALQRQREAELLAANPAAAVWLRLTHAAQDHNAVVQRQAQILSMLGNSHAEVALQRQKDLRSVSEAEAGLLKLQHVLEDIAKLQDDALAEQKFGTGLISFYSELDKETKDLLGGETFVDVYDATDVITTTQTLRQKAMDAMESVNNLSGEVTDQIHTNFDVLEERLESLIGQLKAGVGEISNTTKAIRTPGGATTYSYTDFGSYPYVNEGPNADANLGATIGKSLVDLVKQFEGLELKAYLDQASVPTIGYGHTGPDVSLGMQIDVEQAERLLEQDLQKFVDAVRSSVKVPLSDEQFNALTSLAYNIGEVAFESSTLLKKLNAGDYEGAASEFGRWNKVTQNGVKVESNGLTNRRAIEEDLFRSGGQLENDDFNESLERTVEVAERSVQALADQESQIRSVGEAAQNAGTSIEDGLSNEEVFERKGNAVEVWRQKLVNAIEYQKNLVKQLKEDEKLTDAQIANDERLQKAQEAVNTAQETYNAYLKDAYESQTEAIKSGDLLNYTYQLGAEQIEALGDSFGTANSAQRKYNINMANANQMVQAGEMSLREYNRAIKEYRWELMEAQGPLQAWIAELERSIPTLNDVMKTTMNSFKDTITDALSDGELDFENFVDSVKRMLMEIAVNNIMLNVVGNMAGVTPGTSSPAMSANSVVTMGMDQMFGQAISSAGSSLFGSGLSMSTPGYESVAYGPFGLGEATAMQTASPWATMASAAIPMVGIAAGSMAGNALFEGEYVSTGSTLGSVGGSMAGPMIASALMLSNPVGMAIGALLGGIMGGGIGSLFSDQSPDSEWFRLLSNTEGYAPGELDGLTEKDMGTPLASAETPFGTVSVSPWEDFSGDGVEQSQAVVDAISQVDQTIASVMTPDQIAQAAEQMTYMSRSIDFGETGGTLEDALNVMIRDRLGHAASAVFDDYDMDVSDITGDISELSDDMAIQEIANAIQSVNTMAATVEAWAGSAVGDVLGFTNSMSESINIMWGLAEGLRKTGESSADAVNRMINTVNVAVEAIAHTGQQIDTFTAESLLGMGEALAEIAGGLETLMAMQATYYDHFYTEEEKAIRMQEAALAQIGFWNEEMGLVGDQAITTSAGLRAFIEGLEATGLATEESQQAYISALEIAPAFITLDNAIEALGETLLDTASIIDEFINSITPEYVFQNDALVEMIDLFDELGLVFPPTSEAMYELVQAGAYTEEQLLIFAENQEALALAWAAMAELQASQIEALREAAEEAKAAAYEAYQDNVESLRDASDARIEEINDYYEGIFDGLNEELSDAQDSLNEFSSIIDATGSAIRSLEQQLDGIDETRQNALAEGYAAIDMYNQTGEMPDNINDIIQDLSSVDPNDFSTREEWEAAINDNYTLLSALEGISNAEKEDAEKQIELLEKQIEEMQDQQELDIEAERDNLERLIEAEEDAYDAQVEAIESALEDDIEAVYDIGALELLELEDQTDILERIEALLGENDLEQERIDDSIDVLDDMTDEEQAPYWDEIIDIISNGGEQDLPMPEPGSPEDNFEDDYDKLVTLLTDWDSLGLVSEEERLEVARLLDSLGIYVDGFSDILDGLEDDGQGGYDQGSLDVLDDMTDEEQAPYWEEIMDIISGGGEQELPIPEPGSPEDNFENDYDKLVTLLTDWDSMGLVSDSERDQVAAILDDLGIIVPGYGSADEVPPMPDIDPIGPTNPIPDTQPDQGSLDVLDDMTDEEQAPYWDQIMDIISGNGQQELPMPEIGSPEDNFTDDYDKLVTLLTDWDSMGLVSDSERDQVSDILDDLNITVPGFAEGGYHLGGLRVVGERGPEIEYTGPSHITSNSDISDLFAKGNEGVVKELRAMRKEIDDLKRVGGAQTTSLSRILKIHSRWNAEGLPPDRMDYTKKIAETI